MSTSFFPRQGSDRLGDGDGTDECVGETTPDDATIADILRLLELRLGIEVEAAGLAAERRTAENLLTMERCLDRFERSFDGHEDAIRQDFAFHRAMLDATGNDHFAEVFDGLGILIIPRHFLHLRRTPPAEHHAYLGRLAREHRAILAAVRECDAAAARRAMRRHLTNAYDRYRSIGAGLPVSREA